MASHSAAAQSFREVVEHAGYYQNGRPVPGLLEAASLKANVSIDKQVKYRPIFDAKRLGATAVFELSGSPCIYFKTLDAPEPPAWQLADIHRMAWNHGLAPLLWVITPTKVLVFDCHSRPRHDDVGDPARHILQQFERTERGLRELDELMGFFEIQSGRTWTREPLQRRRRERVDEALLADLETTEQQLIEKGLPAQEAHALLGRSIFVAYLEDRGARASYAGHRMSNVSGRARQKDHRLSGIPVDPGYVQRGSFPVDCKDRQTTDARARSGSPATPRDSARSPKWHGDVYTTGPTMGL